MLRQDPARPARDAAPVTHRKPTLEEVRQFYDRLGGRQDAQAFYEEPAVQDLLRNGKFREAHAVFEFGVGTGRLAQMLLSQYLPAYCLYKGIDISTTMVELTRKRLEGWGTQAAVRVSGGTVALPVADETFDRLVSTYVFEILPDDQIEALLGEARRILTAEGLLCLVNLTFGERGLEKLVSSAWQFIHRVRPLWVGGCRPIRFKKYLDDQRWRIIYHNRVTAYGITSEVIVARKR